MKYFFSLVFVFCFASSFSQDFTDEKKSSIGVFASPIAYTAWFTGYQVIDDEQASGYRRRFTFFSPTGISYQYAVNNIFKIQLGVFTTFENQKFYQQFTSVDHVYKDIDYEVNYLNIPLNVRIFPFHFVESDALGGFFIQLGMNTDFITNEYILSTSHTQIDGHFAIPANYVDPNYIKKESNSRKVKFNRICPTLAIGQEIVGNRFSFFYGGNLQLTAVYQKHNTLEYFKNAKFSLVNVGLSYRF